LPVDIDGASIFLMNDLDDFRLSDIRLGGGRGRSVLATVLFAARRRRSDAAAKSSCGKVSVLGT
jgi:hypothetical protein